MLKNIPLTVTQQSFIYNLWSANDDSVLCIASGIARGACRNPSPQLLVDLSSVSPPSFLHSTLRSRSANWAQHVHHKQEDADSNSAISPASYDRAWEARAATSPAALTELPLQSTSRLDHTSAQSSPRAIGAPVGSFADVSEQRKIDVDKKPASGSTMPVGHSSNARSGVLWRRPKHQPPIASPRVLNPDPACCSASPQVRRRRTLTNSHGLKDGMKVRLWSARSLRHVP